MPEPSRRTFLAASAGAGLAAIATADEKPRKESRLQPLAFTPLPLGRVRPAGWLRNQLRIQANGLSGLLDQFWPDVRDSAWVGGKAEGWERGPYWLDGFIPLAVLLNDKPLIARAEKWVDHILRSQRPDGWLGPVKGNPSAASRLSQYDVWPRYIVLKALTQWQEATEDRRVVPAMTKFLRFLDKLLDEKPLAEWARWRWVDLVLSIHWLYDRTGEGWLLDLAAKVRKQGVDWGALAADFPYKEKVTQARLKEFQQKAGGPWLNDQFGTTHGVNVGMGLKQPGVWYRQSGHENDRKAARLLLEALDRYHGQATGIFTCDEHLAGRSPSQGTETCTVVEAMFSLEMLLAILGEPVLADRLERIAFNALPAPFRPDMSARQYDQQANQVVCKVSPEHVYVNNGPDANVFGLETNFGCCTANMHQGWPKLAAHLWMKSPDGGLAALVYAPCSITTEAGGLPVKVDVATEYPFRDSVKITVRAGAAKVRLPLHLRIPGWARDAELEVEGRRQRAAGGSFLKLDRDWTGDTEINLRLPMTASLWEGHNKSVAVVRGPLVYALRVGAEWKKLRDRGPVADWEVHPTTPWNYALALDRDLPAKSLLFTERPVGERPFTPEGAAVVATVTGRRLPGWRMEKNAAAPPPESPVTSNEPEEELTLVPYGCTSLRVTEFPTLK